MPDDDFRRGPGWHKSPRGAVITAYVDTDALDRVCPRPPRGCGAGLGEFCRFPDGSERHIPCIARTKSAQIQRNRDGDAPHYPRNDVPSDVRHPDDHPVTPTTERRV